MQVGVFSFVFQPILSFEQALDWIAETGATMVEIGSGGYVAEKAEGDTGWLFPVGDEIGSLGYVEMFKDMFNSMDKAEAPRETFYDGYIVNAIIDASLFALALLSRIQNASLFALAPLSRDDAARDGATERDRESSVHFLLMMTTCGGQ